MTTRKEETSSGTGGKRPQSLEGQVCKALRANRKLDASQIGVQLQEASGELTLMGTVPTEEQRRLAETCARAVRGISAVDNRLKVLADGAGR